MSIYNYQKPAIYKITNHVTGKVYIGSTTELIKRHHRHVRELIANKHHSPKLQRAWNKYGSTVFSFQVIEFLENVSNIIIKEQLYCDKYDSFKNGYNSKYPDVKQSKDGQGYQERLEKERKRSKIRREENPEKEKARSKTYYHTHKEEMNRKNKENYYKNKEKINVRAREIYKQKKALLLSQE